MLGTRTFGRGASTGCLCSPPDGGQRRRELRVPNAYRVDIRDYGPGIRTEHLLQIFEEYTRDSGVEGYFSSDPTPAKVDLSLADCRESAI